MNTSAIHDFDFFQGDWISEQRRLKQRLCGCTEWENFTAKISMQKLPGGFTNMDTFTAESWRPGYMGMSFRVYNPQTNLWSIFWISNSGDGIEAQTGNLSQPVVGRFEGDKGIFECNDTLNGKPIRVRYLWTRFSADSARWEQAFSPDGGPNGVMDWETNWVMDHRRA